jgi:hypothetical protein
MSWITENSWPLVLILGGIAAVLLILGESRMRTAALLCAAAAVGLHFLENAIVTASEEVEMSLQEMLDGFKAADLQVIEERISATSPSLKDTAAKGLALVSLSDDFHMKDIVITVDSNEQAATVELRANGGMILKQSDTPVRAATRWNTRWILESGSWKLAEVQRLNPVTGDEIGVLDRQ